MQNNNITLCAESTCDLNDELVKKYHVHYFPYFIILKDKEYKDGVDIFPKDIFEAYWQDGSLPKTAASSIGEFSEFFKQFTDKGQEVIHISLGHGLSSSYENAKMAADNLEGVYVIDSCNLSAGSGQLVIRAGQMIDEGKSTKEIVEELERIKKHVHVSFVLDTLDFMSAGGRCPAIAAKAAGLLKCKPYLSVDNTDGTLHIGKMYRGKQEVVLRKYIKDELNKYKDIVPDQLFLTNSTCFEKDYLKELEKEILDIIPFNKVHWSEANCTISSHCGPKCLGIIFVTNWK